MPNTIHSIYPAILTDSLETVQKQLDLVRGLVERVQIDIVDGEFAENITIHPVDLKNINPQSLNIDLHLMTNDPINDVVECQAVPHLHAVIAQIERMPSQQAFIDHVKSYGWKVGLSLDLHTPESEIEDVILKQLDIVQVMTIQAGAQGKIFHKKALEKVQACAVRIAQLQSKCELLVDGGITSETIESCKQAGATGFVVGHYLWESQNIAESLRKLLY